MKFLGIAALLAVTVVAAPASAAIVAGSLTGGASFANGGQFLNLNNPTGLTLGNDNFNDDNVRAFNEKQRFTLVAPITLGGVLLAAGTILDSHYVVYDPARQSSVEGSVTVDGRVLAVVRSSTQLVNSDFLANPNVSYLNPGSRGLEGNDLISFSGSTVSFNLLAQTPGDGFRILSLAVPEPASWAMLIVGFGLVGATMRRRVRTVAA